MHPTREETITDADSGAVLIVDRPGTREYDRHRFRPRDREADLLWTRHRRDDLLSKRAKADAEGRTADADALSIQAAHAADHLAELLAEPAHPLLGRDMVMPTSRPFDQIAMEHAAEKVAGEMSGRAA